MVILPNSDIQKIETPRLLLREWRPEDLEPFTRLNADDRVRKFIRRDRKLTAEESKAMVESYAASFQECGFGMWALELKSGSAFIGSAGLSVPAFQAHFTPCIDIGWRLAYEYWGNGYATEAAKAVIDHAFRRLGIDEIVSFTVPKNHRSRAVMERIGMKRDWNGDFDHPLLPPQHHLSRHVLYRIRRPQPSQCNRGAHRRA
jgi:RimJ/RimL family protein N-acetyltransferase